MVTRSYHSVLNFMWSTGAAYHSVHLVMNNFIRLNQISSVQHYFLIGNVEHTSLFDNVKSLNRIKKDTKRWYRRFFLQREINHILQSQSHDLLLIDGLGMARLLLPLLKFHRKTRALVFFHGKTTIKRKDKKLFAATRSQIKCVAVSKTLQESLLKQISIPVYALPTFLNLPPTTYTDIEREENKNLLVLGAVGRLEKSKNFSLLIEMSVLLRNKGWRFVLHIAGEGSQRDLLERMIRQYDLEEHIILCGYINDIASFYRRIDLVLVPSLQEGQGLIIQEALHYNVPIVCNNLTVFYEQLSESGVYCSSADEWVQHLEGLFDPLNRKELLSRQQKVFKEYNSLLLYLEHCKNLLAF